MNIHKICAIHTYMYLRYVYIYIYMHMRNMYLHMLHTCMCWILGGMFRDGNRECPELSGRLQTLNSRSKATQKGTATQQKNQHPCLWPGSVYTQHVYTFMLTFIYLRDPMSAFGSEALPLLQGPFNSDRKYGPPVMCVFICMFYTHIHKSTYVYMCICIHIHIHKDIDMHIRKHIHIRRCKRTNMYVYIYIYTCIYLRV